MTPSPPFAPASDGDQLGALSVALVPPKLRPGSVDPEQHAYGYVCGRTARAATWARLLELFRKPVWATGQTLWVWTPESRGLVPAFEVPELVAAVSLGMRRRVLLAACGVLVGAAALLGAWIAWGARNPEVFRTAWFLIVLWVGIPAVSVVATALTLRSSAKAAMAGPSLKASISRVLSSRAARTSQVVTWTWVAFTVLDMILVRGQGASAAGLLKQGPGREEYWRWLTCAFVHVGLLHVMMNASAMSVWGPLVEALAGRGILGVVFLASVLGGSFASWSLLPSPSVGASGGLCGLLGYLLVATGRARGRLPVGMGRMLANSVVALVALGAFLAGMIDNAAHAGGLVTGVGLGLLFPAGVPVAAAGAASGRRILGAIAWTILALGAVGTAVAFIGFRAALR